MAKIQTWDEVFKEYLYYLRENRTLRCLVNQRLAVPRRAPRWARQWVSRELSEEGISGEPRQIPAPDPDANVLTFDLSQFRVEVDDTIPHTPRSLEEELVEYSFTSLWDEYMRNRRP